MGNDELLIMGIKVPCQNESLPLKEVQYKVFLSEAHVNPALTECVLPGVIRRVAGTVVSCPDVIVNLKAHLLRSMVL